MGMVQSDVNVAESQCDQPASRGFRKISGRDEYTAYEAEESDASKHARNMLASQLLLRRLQRLHYEHAGDIFKRRFVPAPLLPSLVTEAIRNKVDAERDRPFFQIVNDEKVVEEVEQAMAAVEHAARKLRDVPMKLIVAIVSRYFNIKPLMIIGGNRRAEFVRARHICCYLGKDISGLSYPAISRDLLFKDHSGPMHGHKVVTDLIRKDHAFAVQVETIRAQIVEYYEASQVSSVA